MRAIQNLLRKKELSFIPKLLKRLPRAELFLVGGIIRDTAVKRPSKDFDFVIRNVGAAKLQSELKKLGWVDLVGKRFGVFKFIPQGLTLPEPIDLALPRTEHALLTGGYRDFDVQSDPKLPIEQDLMRRDFTINAMAYDIREQKLIDRFGGMHDIKKKLIRTVGKPNERFTEDLSRMLRALRFASQLHFSIETQTWRSLKKLSARINKLIAGEYVVPRETVARELTKALTADPVYAIGLLTKSGITEKLMPELMKMKGCRQPRNFHSEGDVWKHTMICMQNLYSNPFKKKFGPEPPSPELIYAALLHDIGKPYTIERADRLRFNNHDAVGAELSKKILSRLRISSSGVDTDRIVWLIRMHLITTHSKKSPMKKTTLEKYFFNDQLPGGDLLRLLYADVQATIPPSGCPDFTEHHALEQQIKKLSPEARHRRSLPPVIMDGNEIMQQLRMEPGPAVGQLKTLLREEQLRGGLKTKKQAMEFLKKHANIRRYA
ncbi:MAG: HDIG domain-containing metalloprotein [Patescibacteria group bacterium]